MDKVGKYKLFLKSLRVALTNVSVYFRQHPIFIKSIQDLEVKIKQLLKLQQSLTIDVTYEQLSCGGEVLEPSALTEDIRNFFHQRKIKNIRIEKGVSGEELATFLKKISLPPRDILLGEGMQDILKKENLPHIKVQDLDYSIFLRDSDSEYQYSWFHLLKNSLKSKNAAELAVLADNFEKMLKQLNLNDPVDLKELETVITDFFTYLQENDKERFLRCLSSFSKLILSAPEAFSALHIDKLKNIFGSLDSDSIAGILFSQLQHPQALDSLNFSLFSQLVRRQSHKEIAASLAGKLEQAKWMKDNPLVLEKIQNIFSLPNDAQLSEVYRHSLFSIMSTLSLGEGIVFDRQALQNNYRFILLDLLSLESDSSRLQVIITKIFFELPSCFSSGDKKFVDKSVELIEEKRKKAPALQSFFEKVNKEVSILLEKEIFSKKSDFDFSRFIVLVPKDAYDAKFYLNKIFNQQVLNPYIFYLFFKFFPEQSGLFCQQVKRRSRQVKFIKLIIDNLKTVESLTALKVLKEIFYFSNNFIKLQILKTMEDFPCCDEGFLFPILKTTNTLFRRQAFKILVKYSKLRANLAAVLFSFPNPFGMRNRRLSENLSLVAQEPFAEAKQYLVTLANQRFFGNRHIQKEAFKILAKYGK